MTETNVGLPESTTPVATSTVIAPEGTPGKMSIRQAAQALRAARAAKESVPSAEEPPSAAEQPTEPVSAPGAKAAPLPEASGSETEAVEPALPAIEPPRFWSAEERERFQTLPRETQEYLSDRERERSAEIDRTQREAAEERKVLEAERLAAEQVRKQNEELLPILLQQIQSEVTGEFADIKTMDDVEKLSRDDWPRFNAWQARQLKINAVRQEVEASRQRQEQERATEWQTYVTKEDALFAESVPEIADPDKGPKLREQAVKYLKEIGYTDAELAEKWNSGYLRDHKVQRAIVDAVKYREAQAQVKSTPPKPVPPVTQRPGVAHGRNVERETLLKNLDQKLDQTGSWKAAAELLMARRQAARRT